MTELIAFANLTWALCNCVRKRDVQTSRLAREPPATCFALARQVVPQTQFAALRTINKLIDRLVTNSAGIAALKPQTARNLLWRPALLKALRKVHSQLAVTTDLATTDPA